MVLMIPGDKKSYEGGAMPEEKLIAAMMKYNEELAKSGILASEAAASPASPTARSPRRRS